MSSSPSRDPLEGIIRQDEKIVGNIALPEADMLEFIEQFNSCYGPLRMHIDAPAIGAFRRASCYPVGAARRRNLTFQIDARVNAPGTVSSHREQ